MKKTTLTKLPKMVDKNKTITIKAVAESVYDYDRESTVLAFTYKQDQILDNIDKFDPKWSKAGIFDFLRNDSEYDDEARLGIKIWIDNEEYPIITIHTGWDSANEIKFGNKVSESMVEFVKQWVEFQCFDSDTIDDYWEITEDLMNKILKSKKLKKKSIIWK